MYAPRFIPALFVAMSFSCSEPQVNEPELSSQPASNELNDGSVVSIKAFKNEYVSCEIAVEGEDKDILIANRDSVGDWERFTLMNRPEGKISLKAANGKFVCWDRSREGILFADRDEASDWETFTLVPMDSGRVALKTMDGTFVSAGYDLPDAHRGVLVGNRQEAHEWETFTLELIASPAAQQ